MNMSKAKKVILGAVATGVVLAGLFAHSVMKPSPTTAPTAGTIFFYGRECPHCQDVEKFLADNNISAQARYDSVEVWHNQDNANLMLEKAKECGLSQDKVGVPFVWSQGKCYIGTPDVEAFFKQRSGS